MSTSVPSDAPARFPDPSGPILFLDPTPGRLPNPLTSLLDREASVATVAALLRNPDVRLLTLTGPGGVGKTRLAIAAADACAADFRNGMRFVSLAPVADPGLVIATIARALGLRDLGSESLHDRLINILADKQLLLVLDNFEHVVTAGPRVREIFDVCPWVKGLVTSRVRLRLSGEREYPVSPLTLPSSEWTSVEEARMSGAVRLFTERAQAISPDFRLTTETLPAIAEIVRRVDGLPLAIELAAARVKVLPPAALLRRLDHRLPLLSGGARDLPLRQQTMRDTIGWSYDLLAPAEQALFRRLAVFVGGFTFAAAGAVSSLPTDPPATADLEVFEGIASLIEQSVLRQMAGPGDEPRYLMLETVREYARERLEERGETEAMQRRHVAFFLAFAEAAALELIGPRQAEWLDRLEADHANLRGAVVWGIENEPELAIRLCSALRLFWRRQGYLGEGIALLQRALASGGGPPAVRAKGLVSLSSLQNLRGDFAAAAANAEEARALFELLEDRLGIAEARRRLAVFQLEQWQMTEPRNPSQFARVQAPWAEELVLRRTLGDHYGAAWAVHDLGAAALREGALDLAADFLEEALPTFEAKGDLNALAFVLTNLGRVATRRDENAKAAALFRRALALFHESGDRWGIAHVLEDATWLKMNAVQVEAATRLLGAVEAARAADGVQLAVADRFRHEQVIGEAREALGEARFNAAFAQGQAMALGDAFTEAMELLALVAPATTTPEASPPEALLGLTPRELEVLRLLTEGQTDREIAEALFMSPRTVSWHVTHVLGKLGVQNRSAAVAAAIRQGLV